MASVLMIASEASPFCKTGGLADVVGSLSRALKQVGHHVEVILPRYLTGRPDSAEVVDNFEIRIGTSVFSVAVSSAWYRGVRFLFVDIPSLFDRRGMYGEAGKDYPDNGVRFGVFCRGALEFARRSTRPDLIHCHDWQTGLIPVFLKSTLNRDSVLGNVKTVFTVHNLGYQGRFDKSILPRLDLDWSLFQPDGIEFWGDVSFLKGGLIYSDYLTTVSPTYAREIQTPEGGFGLDGVFNIRKDVLVGILNGVDYTEWNPESDGHIVKNYSAADLSGKMDCKRDLLQDFGLPVEEVDQPLIGMVSRFTEQKGSDLIAGLADVLAIENFKLIVLGTGDWRYERMLQDWALWFPNKVGALIGYNNKLAHKIEAGADMFLMPSRYEPCGLNQIYSLRYGAVPIVRATGGLEDTVNDETGFKFRDYSVTALLEAVHRAIAIYRLDHQKWLRLVRRGMAQDYSWDYSAREYSKVYDALVSTTV